MSHGTRRPQRGDVKFSCRAMSRPQTPVRYVPKPAQPWSHRSRGDAVGSNELIDRPRSKHREHSKARGLQRPKGQHDDFACLPRARSRQGSDRGSPAPRHGSRPPLRPARRMVSPAPDARLYPSVGVDIRTNLCPHQSPFPGNGISRPETKALKCPHQVRIRHRGDGALTRSPANSGAIRQPPGNLSRRGTAWWAREDFELRARHAVLSNRSLRGRTAGSPPKADIRQMVWAST